MDQVKIGKFISDERKAKGYTQKQLSELLGISDKTIIEMGVWSFPNKRILETIHETPACVKGITIEYYIFNMHFYIDLHVLISKENLKQTTI